MKNKNILITWWTWFLWSHLLEKLINKWYNVILLKRSFSKIDNISWLIKKIKYYNIDEINNIENIFKENKIDIIIHTATDYWRWWWEFNEIIDSNLLFPIKLLELWIKYKINSFINTDTFWDDNIELPIWLTYYAYTKKDFLKYAKKLISNTNVKLINLKVEHLYWPKDNKTKFIPYIINNLLNNVEYIDLTKWEQKKDFIYIKDAVEAYIYILNNLDKLNNSFEDFDLWSWSILSIKELILKINNSIKADTILNFWKLEYRKFEPMISKANKSRFNQLWWLPKYSIDEGIIETINYFKTKK